MNLDWKNIIIGGFALAGVYHTGLFLVNAISNKINRNISYEFGEIGVQLLTNRIVVSMPLTITNKNRVGVYVEGLNATLKYGSQVIGLVGLQPFEINSNSISITRLEISTTYQELGQDIANIFSALRIASFSVNGTLMTELGDFPVNQQIQFNGLQVYGN